MIDNGNSPHNNENINNVCDNNTENIRNGQLKRKNQLIEEIMPSNSSTQISEHANSVNVSHKKHKHDEFLLLLNRLYLIQFNSPI